MATTPLGIRYPLSSDHTRLWEHYQNGFTDVDGLLLPPLSARRTATRTVASSTALADDTEIQVAVVADAVYEMTAMLKYDAETAADLKYQWVGPAGLTLSGTAHQLVTGATSTETDQTTGLTIFTSLVAGGLGTGSTVQLFNHGIVVVSTTPGDFKLQWAQNVSNAVGTRIFADSFLVLRRLA